jgi:DNA-binding response OmpR family regulator
MRAEFKWTLTEDDAPTASGARPSIPITVPRILVVDDDENAAKRLVLALEADGLQAFMVSDGDQALRFLQDSTLPTDLVIVELMLPRRNGLDLAREVARVCPGIRIVLTGSYHLSERQLSRCSCGAIAFVPKPFDAKAVAAFVHGKLS